MASTIDTAMMLDDEQTFDPRAALAELVKSYDNPSAVGRDAKKLAIVVLRFRDGRSSELPDEYIKVFVCTLYNLANAKMSAEVKKAYNADNFLESITNPKHNLPIIYKKIAESLYAEYTAMDWGIVAEPTPEAEPAKRSNKRPSPTLDGPFPKKKIAREFVPSKNNTDHWGPSGIMRHINKYKGKRTTYAIADEYKKIKPTAHVFGHNGLKVGDCWPIQYCLIRDGAHGESQGGITGTGETGCFSILVASGYPEDTDNGQEIWYSEPSAHNTAETNVDEKAKKGALALMTSYRSKKPVRVIRKHTGNWSGAPRAGFRYDGLYHVEDYKERARPNASGKYKLFKLVRDGDQPDIDQSRPTWKERKIFEDVTAPME